MRPELYISERDLKGWVGMPLVELSEQLRTKLRTIRIAADHPWDDIKILLEDKNGWARVTIQVYPGDVFAWIWSNGRSESGLIISCNEKEFTMGIVKQLVTATEKVAGGFTQCQVCSNWVEQFKQFSFAGAVCLDCYNPKVHLPPDTRGD